MTTSIIPSPAINTAPLDAIIDRQATLGHNTKYRYKMALRRMIANKVSPQNVDALIAYADTLTTSNKGFLKAALNTIYHELKLRMKASATKDNVLETLAATWRMEALNEFITVPAVKGTRAHTWLTPEQSEKMLSLCGNDLQGRRDWIVLSILLNCGLRREEMSNASFDWIKSDGIEVLGKGNKYRVIPLRSELRKCIIAWKAEVIGGHIARGFDGRRKVKKLTPSLSPNGIRDLVRKYGVIIGVDNLNAHDMRRTFAQHLLDRKIPIERISYYLGHASLNTTMIYMNIKSNSKDFE